MDVDVNGDVKFDGEGDYVEHRRHKSIFDARETARDVILDAKRQFSRNQISEAALQAEARTAVEMLITEVEQMAAMADNDSKVKDGEIFTIQLQPPSEILQYHRDENHRVLGDRPQPKIPRGGQINGIWQFLAAPEVFTATWSVSVDVQHEGPQTITASNETRMPVNASLSAFRTVNNFLQQSGLDIEPELPEYDGGEEPGL